MKKISMLLLPALFGCASSSNQDTMNALRTRAAFEMDCPQEKIQTTVLKESTYMGRIFDGNTVGVSGCGKKGVYIYNRGTGWVLNSTKK